MILSIRSHSLYYETHGKAGPWVVVLHQGLGASTAWSRQIPAFVQAGFRVLSYDRWGYGRSQERPVFPRDYLLSEPEDLFELLRAVGIERTHLVGHSDGGTIALLFAARYPQRVERMVVASAHIYNEERGRQGLAETRARFESDPGFAQALREVHGEKTDRLVRGWLDLWLSPESADLEMRGMLGEIRAPTLVVQGEQDEFATHRHARDIAEGIHNAGLWLIPNCQHNPLQEKPQEFNRRVIEFLQRGMAKIGERGSEGVRQA